jgi:hypothetical protein
MLFPYAISPGLDLNAAQSSIIRTHHSDAFFGVNDEDKEGDIALHAGEIVALVPGVRHVVRADVGSQQLSALCVALVDIPVAGSGFVRYQGRVRVQLVAGLIVKEGDFIVLSATPGAGTNVQAEGTGPYVGAVVDASEYDGSNYSTSFVNIIIPEGYPSFEFGAP